jgi:hypothetical protein
MIKLDHVIIGNLPTYMRPEWPKFISSMWLNILSWDFDNPSPSHSTGPDHDPRSLGTDLAPSPGTQEVKRRSPDEHVL